MKREVGCVKLVVAGVIFCMGVLPASLLLARVHPFGDVGLYAEGQASTPLMSGAQVPAEAVHVHQDNFQELVLAGRRLRHLPAVRRDRKPLPADLR